MDFMGVKMKKDIVRDSKRWDLDDVETPGNFEETYNNIMSQLQSEWSDNGELYEKRRNVVLGIRSSQVGALVGLLIKKGILK